MLTQLINIIKNLILLFIDADYRKECAIRSLDYIKGDGIIILDNSNWFYDVAKILREKNYIQVDFAGFEPENGYTWVTSVFLSRKVNLKPLKNQPEHCIGGGKLYATE